MLVRLHPGLVLLSTLSYIELFEQARHAVIGAHDQRNHAHPQRDGCAESPSWIPPIVLMGWLWLGAVARLEAIVGVHPAVEDFAWMSMRLGDSPFQRVDSACDELDN